MNIISKNKLLVSILATLFIATLVFYGVNLSNSQRVFAAEIDYVNQNYTDMPVGFDNTNEDVIYKIHCPNVRTQLYGENQEGEVEDYVTRISFRASMGCQIYFVEGVACNCEDSYSGDYAWNYYANYYKILHYDDVNKNVYIKFKNLSSLDADDTVSGNLEDFGIMYTSNTYVNSPQYIYLSNIEQPVTEITSNDILFSSQIYASHGARGWSNYNIYMIEWTFRIDQRVSHLVDKVEISFIEGGDAFSLKQSSFTTADANGQNGYLDFELYTIGDINDITERVKLQAVVTYGDKSVSTVSLETSLIDLWTELVNNDFADDYYKSYMTETNKKLVTKFVKTYSTGFFNEIKGSKNYFADYNANTDIKLTSLIFKIPMNNFRYASFSWNTSYYQGYIYSASVRISDDFTLSTSVYKMAANEDGTVTVANTITNNDSAATALYDKISYFAYDDNLYVRINDYSAVTSFFPQKATTSFSASATDKNSAKITIQANTATIIYDDYNKELLAEIETLKTQLAEVQKLLADANLLTEQQKEKITALQSSLDGLEVDYSIAQSEIEYMKEQIEVMREEYQKKIDQLIAENGSNKPSTDTTPEDDNTAEETDLKATQILGICAGLVLLIAIIILLIPKRRK